MLYLFDANVLITANNTYYPVSDVPEFWEWVHYHGTKGNIKLPVEILEEILAGNKSDDPLIEWLKVQEHYEALLLDEQVDQAAVQQIVNNGYAPNLTDDELEEIGRDPFLIAYALVRQGARTVVTTEVSSPRKHDRTAESPTCAAASMSPFAIPSSCTKHLGSERTGKDNKLLKILCLRDITVDKRAQVRGFPLTCRLPVELSPSSKLSHYNFQSTQKRRPGSLGGAGRAEGRN